MEHHFNVEVAEKHGVEEAILIHNIAFWLIKNKANDKNYYDGYYWTYNSAKSFSELFPYFNSKKISRLLNRMEDIGVIKSGNYNKSAYDRTKWYTIIDKEIMDLYKLNIEFCIVQKCQMEHRVMSDEIHKSVQPIPYIKQDNKQDNKQEDISSIVFSEFVKEYADIVTNATGVAKNIVEQSIFNNMMTLKKYDCQLLLQKIKESDYLMGKLERKPNVSNFSRKTMIDRIMADEYKSKEEIKQEIKSPTRKKLS